MTIFDSNDFDFDSIISYKQKVSTDKIPSIVTLESTVNEFIFILTEKIFEFCHHNFMKVSAYPKEANASIDNEMCTILMDVAENYSFFVQHTM